jgi:hypothetical protein
MGGAHRQARFGLAPRAADRGRIGGSGQCAVEWTLQEGQLPDVGYAALEAELW